MLLSRQMQSCKIRWRPAFASIHMVYFGVLANKEQANCFIISAWPIKSCTSARGCWPWRWLVLHVRIIVNSCMHVWIWHSNRLALLQNLKLWLWFWQLHHTFFYISKLMHEHMDNADLNQICSTVAMKPTSSMFGNGSGLPSLMMFISSKPESHCHIRHVQQSLISWNLDAPDKDNSQTSVHNIQREFSGNGLQTVLWQACSFVFIILCILTWLDILQNAAMTLQSCKCDQQDCTSLCAKPWAKDRTWGCEFCIQEFVLTPTPILSLLLSLVATS